MRMLPHLPTLRFRRAIYQLGKSAASPLARSVSLARSAVAACALAVWLVVMAVSLALPVLPVSAAEPADAIDFDTQVAPILVSHCLDCHGGSEPKAGLSLQRSEAAMLGGDSGPVIVAGKADESELWLRVESDDMPPKHPLADQDKALLKAWIEQGAAWGTSPIDAFAATTATRAGRDWWSLQPLRQVDPPTTDGVAVHPIDAFVRERLRAANDQLAIQPQADPRTLLRRLYFDLIGLPPTPEQVQAFAANPSPEAYKQCVEQLLASPAYGERWARHWLDVVRFGESDGFERNMPREHAWLYRDWVIDALNEDLPYDEFVRQQLIGDQLDGGIRGAAATGFWVAGVHNTVVGGSERMKQLARQDEIEEVLATIGQTFLGLTINCARCHDHKFDPISQTEFYQLASAISGLGYGDREVQDPTQAEALQRLESQRQRLSEQLAKIDTAARAAILAAREANPADAPAGPQPFAVWEFDDNAQDAIGQLHGRLQGTAKLEDGALLLDGGGYLETAPIDTDIAEKTLEVWVQLDDLQQRGGGVLSIESRDGVIFDSIVFGEQQPEHWMAGSNNFLRTASFQAAAEDAAQARPVHVALVYEADGTIRGYRDGLAYGQPIRKSALQTYKAGQTELVFGLRHKPFSEARALRGRVYRAAFYNTALSPAQIAASAGRSTDYVSQQEIVDSLSAAQRAQRQSWKDQLDAITQQRDQVAAAARRTLYTLTASRGAPTHVLLRGDPDNLGPLVAPAAVAAIGGLSADFGLPPDAPEADRRRKLADWITDPANPMFSRVIVNRVWHYHFGTGILDTPNDFGFNGGRPSHPDLLEFLAAGFRDDGFRLKNLHRLIVTSQTYRQASRSESPAIQTQGQAIDANNRLLWRGPSRRLEAEAIRDAMLCVAGKLNDTRGGPSFKDVAVNFVNGTTYYEPLDVDGEAFFRRTVYRFNPRGGRSALLDTFDCPDSSSTAPRRAVTTTPLQALSLLNNAFVLRMAEYFAQRVAAEAGEDTAAQIKRAWQLALARSPTQREAELSRTLVDQHGLPALCRGLFNSNEFVIVD